MNEPRLAHVTTQDGTVICGDHEGAEHKKGVWGFQASRKILSVLSFQEARGTGRSLLRRECLVPAGGGRGSCEKEGTST